MIAAPATPAVTAPAVADPTEARRLDRALVHGVAWTGAIQWSAQALSWVATLLVARLLMPSDYGVVGMATLYLGLAAIVTEFGIGSTVLARPDLSRSQTEQLHSLATLVGLTGFAVSCAAAGPLSVFFRTPELRWVVIALSLSFIFGALRSVPGALMSREHRFRELALVEASRALASPLATVLLALAGAGYWSLVFGNLLGSCLWTLLLVRRRPVEFAWPRLPELRGLMTFSSQVLVSRTAWYAYSGSDFLVAGRLLGPAALGAYTYAWTLAHLAGEKVLSVVMRVTPGVMSAVNTDRTALRRYLLGLTELVTVGIWPVVGGLALVAPEFVQLVLGDQWLGVIAPLQLLAVYAAVQAMVTLLPQVLIITGQARYDMTLSLVALVLFPPAFYFFGGRWGTVGIATAWLVVYPVILAPLFARVFRTTGTPVRLYLRSLWPAASGTAVMAAAVLLVRFALPADTAPAPALALEVAAGGVAYLGCMLSHRARLSSLIGLLRQAGR